MRNHTCALAVSIVLCIGKMLSASSFAQEDDDTIIGARPEPAAKPVLKEAEKKRAKALIDYLRALSTEAQFQADALAVAKILGTEALTKDERQDLEIAIARDVERSAKVFSAMLDWHRTPDVKLRLGAIEALRSAYTATMGTWLGASALSDPDENVRRAVTNLIKERNDRVAVKYLFGAMLKSSENGEATPIGNDAMNKAAIAALRDIGDKQTYQALVFFERISINVGITGAMPLDGIKIVPPNVDLPISVANQEVGFMQFTQTFPGVTVLKALTGMDFGHDLKKWDEWIDKQPDYKPVVK